MHLPTVVLINPLRKPSWGRKAEGEGIKQLSRKFRVELLTENCKSCALASASHSPCLVFLLISILPLSMDVIDQGSEHIRRPTPLDVTQAKQQGERLAHEGLNLISLLLKCTLVLGVTVFFSSKAGVWNKVRGSSLACLQQKVRKEENRNKEKG